MNAEQDLTARSLRAAWTAWIEETFKGSETSLVTLTFARRQWESEGTPSLSRVQRAARSFEKCLTKSLAGVSYFIVLERGGWNGRMHLHSLISSLDAVPIREAMLAHQVTEGFVSVRQVATSASQYVTKYVSKSDQDFWLAGGPLFRA